MDRTALEKALQLSLEWAFGGGVTVSSGKVGKVKLKTFNGWAGLRKHIQKFLSLTHPGGAHAGGDTTDEGEAADLTPSGDADDASHKDLQRLVACGGLNGHTKT